MKQSDFIIAGADRGYTQDEIRTKIKDFRNAGYSFDDDEKPQFTPNAILNTDVRETMSDEEVSAYNNTTTSLEEAQSTLYAFEGAKRGDSMDSINRGTNGNLYDDLIRLEEGIPDDQDVDYEGVLAKRKSEFTEEDDSYFVSNADRYANAVPQDAPKVTKPELAPFDISLPLRPIRGYYEDVMAGKLSRDLEYNPVTGTVVKGSGDISGNYRYGLYNIATDQRIAFAATRGDKEEVANLIRQKAEVQQAIGSAFDYSDRSYFSPKRAFLTATQSAPLMLEQGLIAAPFAIGSIATTVGTGGTGTAAGAVIANAGRAVNIAYLQQQGAGTMLEAYLSDKDVANMSDEEFQRATAIANTAGVPYALIERLVNLPSIGKLNFGGITGAGVNKRLTNFVMNKLMTDKVVGNAVRKGSFILAYRTLGETVEEGLQQIVQESTGMTLEQSDEARSLIADIGAGLKDQANIETIAELSKGGVEAMVEALPSVAVSMGLPSVIETVQTDEFKAAVQEVQMNRAALEKDPVKRRDNINKELKNQGVPEEIALDLAEQAVLAQTPEEIQDVISKANDAVNEFSQAEETDIQVFTTEDWTVARETMADEDLDNFINNHPEIRDDFVAGVNGDVKAQERYNAWAKNNRDTEYLDFLIRNKRRDPKFNARQDDFAVLTPKVVNDLLNTDKYDAKIKKYQREGESLAETKSRVLSQLRNKKSKNIADQVIRIKSALSRIAPNVTIKTYATTEEYNSATGKEGGGFYEKGVIHINEELASETTIAHEAFHALLENILTEGTYNDQINRMFDVVMTRGDTELAERLQRFMALYPDYSEVAQKEEAMAELAGIMASSYTSLPSIRTSIYEFLNKILSVAGIKLANDETEVIGFLRSVERGFSTGTVITEEQTKPIAESVAYERDSNNKEYGKEQRKIYETEGKQTAPQKTEEPKKTITAYKLFRIDEDNKLYPLYVYSKEAVPEGEWVEAKVGKVDKKTGKVKGGEIKSLAMRAGWHATDEVTATQIGGKTERYGEINYRKPNTVWAEVEISADVNYQEEANASPTRDLRDKLPVNGYYNFKTNPNATGNWVIGGKLKIVNRLSKEEKQALYDDQGYADLPFLNELVVRDGLTFNGLTKVAQGVLKKFYPNLYSEMQANPDSTVSEVPSEPEIPYLDNYGEGAEQRVPTSMEGDIKNVSAELLPEDKKQTAIEKLLSGFPPAFSESELGKQITDEKTPASERLDLLINTLKENLKSLYEDVPDDIKERSKLWYDGANAIARDVSARTGLTVDQVGGVIATQSPQKDWFMNVQQALNIIDVYQNHIDEKIDVTAMSDAIDLFVLNPKEEFKQQIRRELVEKINNMSLREALEVDSKEYNAYAGLITRIISLHTHGQSFDILSPEGVPVEIKLKKDGTPARHGFGSNSEIYKAISILEDGSIENISDRLGKAHKVRSFYNNIVQPSSNNDVTIDTHAYAAAFMFPHSGTDVGVKALFSSSPMVKNLRKKEEGDIENRSSLVYALLADAYRDIARELGVLPRELQSITWEKIRKIFPDNIKSSIKKSLSSAIGEEYGKESYREEAVNNELDSYEWTQYRTDADRRNQEGTAYVRRDTEEGTQLVGDLVSDGDRRGVAEARRPIVSVSFESFNQPKEQRTEDEADFDAIFGEEINFDFSNAGIDNIIEALGLDKRTPSERIGLLEATKAALQTYGTLNGKFDKNYFLKNMYQIAVESIANGSQDLVTHSVGYQVAISILQKEIQDLDASINGAYARGHTDIAMDLEATRDSAAEVMNQIISAYTVAGKEAGRALAYRRWQGRTKDLQYYLTQAIRANGGALEKEDLDFITNTFNEMQETEDEIESTVVDTSDDIRVGSDVAEKVIYEHEEKATKKNAFFKKRVANTEALINKGLNKLKIVFRAKFGGKEQRIPAAGFRGGVIDTENYEGREEQLIARLAEVFVNRAVEEGRKVSPEDIYKQIQDTLVVDKKEFTIDQIKMAIANNTLPSFDLKKQYVAFMALLKIAANADTRVNELAAKLFDIEKETRANPKNVKEFLAELDKLEEALEGLANTLNTIYDDEMVGKIREKIENLKTAAHQVGNPKSSKKARSEAVTKAQEELAELRAVQKLEKQIAELEVRLKNNDFTSILNKKKRTKKTEKVLELERKLNALRVRLRSKIRRLEETKQENFLFAIPVGGRRIPIYKYHLADIIGFPRLALTMADMSAVARQGLLLSARHPFIASKVFKDAFMTFFKETTSEEVDIYVRKRAEDYNLEEYGLFIRDIDGGLIQGEEAFTSRLGDKIPVFKTIRRMSERHMVNYLNMLGVEIMIDLMERNPDLRSNEKAMEAWANFVNMGLGRGDLGKFAGAADQLSLVFFSPRFTMSRIQLAPKSIEIFNKHPELRTEVMTTWLSFLGAGMTVLTLASLAGAEVGDDPEDSDFGKIVIGDRRWDIWAGFQQPFRLLAQAIKKGVVPDDDVDLWRAGSNFVKWKLSPPFGIFHEFVYGEDWVTGQDIGKGEAALQSLTPILFQTAIEAHKQELTLFEGATLTIPEFFGVSSGVYQKKNKKSKSSYF